MMRKACLTILCFFLCLTSFGQNKIDFVDFFQSLSWEWSRGDFEDRFGNNVSGVADSLVVSNVCIGDYNGDLVITLGGDEKVPRVFLYRIPEESIYKISNILSDRLGKPDSFADNEFGLNVIWTRDDKILVLANVSELSAITCYSISSIEMLRQALLEAMNPEHLKFKGIPIDGTPIDFVTELKSQGFYNAVNHDGTWVLEGPFAGYNRTHVFVSSTNNLVYNVAVIIDFSDDWATVKGAYNRLKASLTKKYEVEPKVEEHFPSYPNEGSGREYRAFLDKKAQYSSYYTVPNGGIQLYISRLDAADGFEIFISYTDTENLSKHLESAENDL